MKLTEAQRIFEIIAPKLRDVDSFFASQLDSSVPLIRKLGEHILAGGGKRMRPALMLIVSRMLGYEGQKDVHYAAMLELIHTATLVHDDIIDEASIRRGRESMNSQWGNNLTVLLGDYIYTKSMQIGLEAGDLGILKLVCATTLTMIEGEMIAFNRNGDLYLSREDYLDIVRRKTACLFAACCRVPALLSGTDETRQIALQDYGYNLGMSFQLIDDLLDFTSSESILGKPVLADLREGKVTLPLILFVPRSLEAERRKVEAVLADRSFERVGEGDILRLANKYGTLEETRALAREYAETAKLQLAVFPPSEAKEALLQAPDYIIQRKN